MEKDIRNRLGPTIKFYRQRMGITQQHLAECMNSQGIMIDRTIIVKIENQTRGLNVHEIDAIVKIFKIDYNDFFTDISK